MYKTRLIFLMSVFGIPLLTNASGEAGEACNAALNQGIRDNYYLLTERQQFESYQQRLCDAQYSSYEAFRSGSAKFGLSIPLAEGLLGMSGSSASKSERFSEAYAKFCVATYFDSEYKDRFSSYASQVSTVLAENWSRCHELHLDAWVKKNELGVFIDVVPQDNFSDFTVTVENKKLESGKIRISDLSPADINCTRGGSAVQPAVTEIERNVFQMTCTKSPLRDINFSIETNAGPSNSIRVPANNSKFLELDDRYRILQAQMIKLQNELEEHKKKYESLGKTRSKDEYTIDGPRMGLEDSHECPAGTFVSKIHASGSVGGKYAVDGISQIKFICSPLR